VPREALLSASPGESSQSVRERVTAARARALARQQQPNAALAGSALDQYCSPEAAGRSLLAAAIERLGLSARAVPRVLRLARTIADLACAERVLGPHLAEAIGYRRAIQ
jgi:magnesium chelatase family protein